MNDYFLSLIRTAVPAVVGAALTYLAVRFGFALPEDISSQLAIGATGLVIAGYYALVRALETRWPWFGKLLGAKRAPAYVAPRR